MKSISQQIDYINICIECIDLPDHNLSKIFGISEKKLLSNFKKYVRISLLDYLLIRKMEYIKIMKKNNISISYTELMTRANYHYTERTLSFHLKKYTFDNPKFKECMSLHANNSFILDFIFTHNASVLTEISVRFILLANLATPKIKEGCCIINHKVGGNFQYNGVLPIEKLHKYNLFFNASDQSLSFDHVWIQREFDNKNLYYPNTITPYFQFLFTLNKMLKKDTDLPVLDSVKNWNNYVKIEGKIKCFIESYILKVNTVDMPKLEIDRSAAFIQQTDFLIEDIKTRLIRKYNNKLIKRFGVTYETLIKYIKAVDDKDPFEMKNILLKIKLLNENRVRDLFFRLTELPYLEDYVVDDKSQRFNDNLTCQLYFCPKEKFIQCILELRKEMDNLSEDKAEEFDSDIWLNNYLVSRFFEFNRAF